MRSGEVGDQENMFFTSKKQKKIQALGKHFKACGNISRLGPAINLIQALKIFFSIFYYSTKKKQKKIQALGKHFKPCGNISRLGPAINLIQALKIFFSIFYYSTKKQKKISGLGKTFQSL